MEPKIKTLKKTVPVKEFCERFLDSERFGVACSRCPGYGMTWACPPYDFDILELWMSYKALMLYAKKVLVPDEMRMQKLSPDEITAAYDSLLGPVKTDLLNELFVFEGKFEGAMALSVGGCGLCHECTRKLGEACRFPERKRFSIESLGGDVGGCLDHYFGEKLLWTENGILPEYFVIMGGLLMK